VASAPFQKSVAKDVGELEKCKSKIIKMLSRAVTAAESTFKGSKTPWSVLLKECEEVYRITPFIHYYLFLYVIYL